MGTGAPSGDGDEAETALEAKANRLYGLARKRDSYFRRSVMADGAMTIMLSLFLGELRSIQLTDSTLALINMFDDNEGDVIVENLVHAGLAVVTGDRPERRTVGLTPLGSARMRSYISDHPDI